MKVPQESADTLANLSYLLNGLAMRVYRELGHGFSEAVYKDALEVEFLEAGISFQREKAFSIWYRGTVLKHTYIADFVVCDEIIIEAKSQKTLVGSNYQQTINYLAVSKCKLGLIYNFGEQSLLIKRVVL